jgi:hypothetical protein
MIHDKSDGAERTQESAASFQHYVLRIRSGPSPGLIMSELSARAGVDRRCHAQIGPLLHADRPLGIEGARDIDGHSRRGVSGSRADPRGEGYLM